MLRKMQDDTARRGAFIVLEGTDRTGKSTQCEKLIGYLHSKGMNAYIQRFPGKNQLFSFCQF